MRIGPPLQLPNNLTIALIERDRHFPEAAARRHLNRLPSTMVAVAQRGRFVPPAVLLPSLGHLRYAAAHQQRTLPLVARPVEWPYKFDAGESNSPPLEPYVPHRIPLPGIYDLNPKSNHASADEVGRLIDVLV